MNINFNKNRFVQCSSCQRIVNSDNLHTVEIEKKGILGMPIKKEVLMCSYCINAHNGVSQEDEL